MSQALPFLPASPGESGRPRGWEVQEHCWGKAKCIAANHAVTGLFLPQNVKLYPAYYVISKEEQFIIALQLFTINVLFTWRVEIQKDRVHFFGVLSKCLQELARGHTKSAAGGPTQVSHGGDLTASATNCCFPDTNLKGAGGWGCPFGTGVKRQSLRPSYQYNQPHSGSQRHCCVVAIVKQNGQLA